MFTYFHDHKNKYNKGQLAPVYILVLVILIIMAMVTVNLSKVAMVKTDTANSADAGALATGAIMANMFNSVAVQNNLMMNMYWAFYMSVSVAFVVAFVNLTKAYIAANAALEKATEALGMPEPPRSSCEAKIATRATYPFLNKASASLTKVLTTINTISAMIVFASAAQQFNYNLIRKMAIKGRISSIRNGHGFVFSNSGIGSKLKAGSPGPALADPLKKNGYRDSYVDFLDNISDDEAGNEHYNYSWKDGQDRPHSVDSNVHTNKVDDFKLKVAVAPTAAETAFMLAARLKVESAITSLVDVKLDYMAAALEFVDACTGHLCCTPKTPTCCNRCVTFTAKGKLKLIPGIAENTAALTSMTLAFASLVLALAGLLPGRIVSSSGNWMEDAMNFICWISKIEHDHLVRIDTTQSHQGADLGLWKTRYPDTASYAVVDFSGRGSIDPPNPRYGSDIVKVDKIRED